MDFAPGGQLAMALIEARSFLAAHDSCAVVEVWNEGELVARVDEVSAPLPQDMDHIT